MAHEENHKTPDEYEDRAWELMKKIQFALFTTWNGSKQAQWPLTAKVERHEHAGSYTAACPTPPPNLRLPALLPPTPSR